jgi:3-oxoacyl-[acyl-carrier protein] reductase
MDLDLAGKTALVTGSSKGLGKTIAQALHKEGCNVVLNGREAFALEHLCAELGERATAIAADVTDAKSCRDMVIETEKRFGKIDILVCNVGSGRSVPPGRENPSEWRRMLDLNLASTTNMVEAATESLARTHGAVLCISSICGIEALGAPVTYSAAKAALNAYVRGMARPLGHRGIRINAIAPGNLVFEGSVWERKLKEDAVAVEQMLQREVALRRLGKAEEIADYALFLVSPRSAFATGAVFVVDGGQTRS